MHTPKRSSRSICVLFIILCFLFVSCGGGGGSSSSTDTAAGGSDSGYTSTETGSTDNTNSDNTPGETGSTDNTNADNATGETGSTDNTNADNTSGETGSTDNTNSDNNSLGGSTTGDADTTAEVTLAWDPSPDYEALGYMLYYNAEVCGEPYDGTDAIEGGSPIDVGNVTEFTVTGLKADQTYCFAVTAYGTGGVESDYSESITF